MQTAAMTQRTQFSTSGRNVEFPTCLGVTSDISHHIQTLTFPTGKDDINYHRKFKALVTSWINKEEMCYLNEVVLFYLGTQRDLPNILIPLMTEKNRYLVVILVYKPSTKTLQILVNDGCKTSIGIDQKTTTDISYIGIYVCCLIQSFHNSPTHTYSVSEKWENEHTFKCGNITVDIR